MKSASKVYNKKARNKRYHEFLLTFFDKEPQYQVKEVNGFILVKQYNGNTNSWDIAIFTPESFSKGQTYYQQSVLGVEKPVNKGNLPHVQVPESETSGSPTH